MIRVVLSQTRVWLQTCSPESYGLKHSKSACNQLWIHRIDQLLFIFIHVIHSQIFKVSFILIVFSQLQIKSTCYKLCDHMIDIQYNICFFQCLKLWPIPIGNIDITPKDPSSLLFIIQHRNSSNAQDIFKLTVWCIHFDGTNA